MCGWNKPDVRKNTDGNIIIGLVSKMPNTHSEGKGSVDVLVVCVYAIKQQTF